MQTVRGKGFRIKFGTMIEVDPESDNAGKLYGKAIVSYANGKIMTSKTGHHEDSDHVKEDLRVLVNDLQDLATDLMSGRKPWPE